MESVVSNGQLEDCLELLRALHVAIRDRVLEACERSAFLELASPERAQPGDTIYAIDRIGEGELLRFLEPRAEALGGLVLIAEGLRSGSRILPRTWSDCDARLRVIMDPIDGTRGLMYQKRSAWILSAVAPNHGPRTRLSHVMLALQTEIPLVKQHLCDELWAMRGRGARAERYDRIRNWTAQLLLEPTRAVSIEHGFASLARFFPGARDELAAIDDEILHAVLGPSPPGKALCFEDQYASTAGQLYELMCGHDRFVADLRPLLGPILAQRGLSMGLCCHPYDICTLSIAAEFGVCITNAWGEPLDVPLDLETNVAWAGYANPAIRAQVEPALQQALRRRGWAKP